ncbi:MAG TPA: hypothetical protein VIL20_22275, partial [Sandaracinaceae bacterium]
VGRVHVYQRTASGTEVISLEPTVAAMDLAFGLRMVAIDASTAGRAGVRIATPFAGMGHVFAYRVEADGTLSGPVELDAPGLAAEAAFGYFMGAVGMWPVMGRSSSPSARRETRTPRGGPRQTKTRLYRWTSDGTLTSSGALESPSSTVSRQFGAVGSTSPNVFEI